MLPLVAQSESPESEDQARSDEYTEGESPLSQPFTVSLATGAALDVKSSATDGGTAEVVYDCPIPTVTAAILRVRYVLCSGTGVTINYTIDPS